MIFWLFLIFVFFSLSFGFNCVFTSINNIPENYTPIFSLYSWNASHFSFYYKYFNYSIKVNIIYSSQQNLDNALVKIVFDTASLISEGLLKSDCSDLFAFDKYGRYLQTYVENCNSVNTVVYILLRDVPQADIGKYVVYLLFNSSLSNNFNKSIIYEQELPNYYYEFYLLGISSNDVVVNKGRYVVACYDNRTDINPLFLLGFNETNYNNYNLITNLSNTANLLFRTNNIGNSHISFNFSSELLFRYDTPFYLYFNNASIVCRLSENNISEEREVCLLAAGYNENLTYNLHVGWCNWTNNNVFIKYLLCKLLYYVGVFCYSDEECITGICGEDFDEDDGAWCVYWYQCAHNGILYNYDSCVENHFCWYNETLNRSYWTTNGDLREDVCSCVVGFDAWIENISWFEDGNPKCCGDDENEYYKVNNYIDTDIACCDNQYDCSYLHNCYDNGTIECVYNVFSRCEYGLWNNLTKIIHRYNQISLYSLVFYNETYFVDIQLKNKNINLLEGEYDAYYYELGKTIKIKVELLDSVKKIYRIYLSEIPEDTYVLIGPRITYKFGSIFFNLAPSCKVNFEEGSKYDVPIGSSIVLHYKAYNTTYMNPCTGEFSKVEVPISEYYVEIYKIEENGLVKIKDLIVTANSYDFSFLNDYGCGSYLLIFKEGDCIGEIIITIYGCEM